MAVTDMTSHLSCQTKDGRKQRSSRTKVLLSEPEQSALLTRQPFGKELLSLPLAEDIAGTALPILYTRFQGRKGSGCPASCVADMTTTWSRWWNTTGGLGHACIRSFLGHNLQR